MTIPASLTPQRDFSAGQLDAEMARSDDQESQRAGAKVMENCAILANRGYGRRPGFDRLFEAGFPMDQIEPVPVTIFEFEFGDGKMLFYDGTVLVQTLGGFPWGASIVSGLNWVTFGRFIVVVHQSHIPQVVEYDPDAGTWARADLAFRQAFGASEKMPFLRFTAFGETLQPSATTGAGITVTFSADVLVPEHVGVLFRYSGRQLRIVSVTDGQNGTADVLDELPPTHRITFAVSETTDGFRVGEIVEGDVSNATGEIVDIVSATVMDVALSKNFNGFQAGETVVGPTTTAVVGGADSVEQSPAAATNWDEAFMSVVRGWPGSVFFDRQRLGFTDFVQAPTAVLWSAIDASDDFEPGADGQEAIFEFVPQDSRVLHVTGGPDQFVFTDKGVFYIPISASTPLAPGTVEFRSIGSGAGASTVPPVPTNEGILYLSRQKTRIMAVRFTGQQTRPYQLVNVSRFHSNLIRDPVRMAADPGGDDKAGEFLYIVNSDGTMAIGRFDNQTEFVGFLPWVHTGKIKWVSANFGRVLMAVEYTFGEVIVNTIERLNPEGFLDGMITVPAMGLTLPQYASQTMSVMRNGEFDGEVTLDVFGNVPVAAGGDEVVIGFNFTPRFVPFAQNFAGGESFRQRTRRRKKRRVVVTVRNTRGGWRVNNSIVASYGFGENEELPAPRRDKTYAFRFLGRDHDPEDEIVQDVPGPFTVIEVARDMTS